MLGPRPEPDVHTASDERLAQLFGGERLFPRDQARLGLDHCHLRPERAEGLGHLDPDDAAA